MVEGCGKPGCGKLLQKDHWIYWPKIGSYELLSNYGDWWWIAAPCGKSNGSCIGVCPDCVRKAGWLW